MVKQIVIDNIKFTRDDKTGYYLASKKINGKRPRLHVYIWEKHNGERPKGFDIHHKDHNKDNNDISNLVLVSSSNHTKHHAIKYAESNLDSMIENLNKNARPKAIEWHKSEEGRNWHKEHYENNKDKFHVKEKYTCNYCGVEFETFKGNNKFCSNKCKSAWRRKEGLDNEERTCFICNKPFITNKYSKAMTCSNNCRGKLKWLNNQK